MEYLDIIEENFTKSDYVAYLRGSILMCLLEDKPFDTTEFKLYTDKLVEAMEEQSTDTTDDECHCLQTQAPEPTVDPDEPRVIKPFKFKLGDHVIISKGTVDKRTGVIVRLPMEGVDCSRSYVVDLDDKNLGWDATVAVDGVDCKNAWVAGERNLQLLEEQPELPPKQPENALEPNKWYHTQDFTVEKLKELLPSGTRLQVEKQVLYDGIETTPPTKTLTTTVESVTTSFLTEKPLIKTTNETFLKKWFMLAE